VENLNIAAIKLRLLLISVLLLYFTLFLRCFLHTHIYTLCR